MDHQLAVELSRGLAIVGAGLAVSLACSGSGKGIGIASQTAGGVLSEKPELFGRLLVLLALPGTQGFYGFITAILIFQRAGFISGELVCTPGTGIALLMIGLGVGLAEYITAVWQGEASSAAIALVARRPDAYGRSIILPAMVETYAVVSLLIGILAINWLTSDKGAILEFLKQ